MLDEDKIRVMTKLAVFEKKEEDTLQIASKYYKYDYISYSMIWTAIATTISFVLGVALYLFCRMDYYINNIQKINLVKMGVLLLIIYLIILAFFEVFSFFYYRKKYSCSEKKIKKYCAGLKELEKIYNKEHLRQTRATMRHNLSLEGTVSDDEYTRV